MFWFLKIQTKASVIEIYGHLWFENNILDAYVFDSHLNLRYVPWNFKDLLLYFTSCFILLRPLRIPALDDIYKDLWRLVIFDI